MNSAKGEFLAMENRRTFLGLAAALLPIGIDAQTAAQTADRLPRHHDPAANWRDTR